MRSSRRLAPVVLFLTAALAGCGGTAGGPNGGSASSGGSAESDGKVELRMSWWGSDSRHTYTKKVIDLFEAKHPNITVKPDYTNFDDYWNKLATAVSAGNGPDVMQQDVRYVREYAARGALADLSPYLGKDIANADFDPLVSDTGTVDGKPYAVPTGVNAFVIVANPALFSRAGVPLPDDSTWTWDDLRSTAAAITAKSPKGTYGLQDLGYVDVSLDIFARQHGETLFDAGGKVAVSKATLTAWYTYLAGLRDSGAEPPASLSVEIQNGGVDRSLLATGKGAMGGWWTNQLPALEKAAGTDLKLLRMPGDSTRPGTFFKPAMFWSIGAGSAHPRESAQLVDFLMNDPDVAALARSDRGLPTNLKLRAAISSRLTPADQQGLAFIKRVRSSVGAQPLLQPKGTGKLTTAMSKINEQVLFGRIQPDAAADSFLQQANAAIRG